MTTRRRRRLELFYTELYHHFACVLCNHEGSYLVWRRIRSPGRVRRTIFPIWATEVDTNCGICLQRPPLLNGGYWCTPANTLTFAHTRMDGCHFSFLLDGGEWSEAWLEETPVVMTCPAGGCIKNVIVAESLIEFLKLGLRNGYGELYRLTSHVEDFDASHPFVLAFSQSDPSISAGRRAALWGLARQFRLRPRDLGGRRLAKLQAEYLPRLTYSQEFHDICGGPPTTSD